MEFKVTAAPEKVQDLVQLLKIWQGQGLIQSFEEIRIVASELSSNNNRPNQPGQAGSSSELASHYRDLVD